MSKHTPGPWKVEADPYHFMTLSTIVAGEIGKEGFNRMVVQVGGWNEWNEQEANARLIAAAPDLLEALERLSGWFDSDSKKGADKYLKKAKAAIAKARGEG